MHRFWRKSSSRNWTRSGSRRHAEKQKLLEHLTFKFPLLAFQLDTRSAFDLELRAELLEACVHRRLDRHPQRLCLPLLPAVEARQAQFLDSPEFGRFGSWSQRLRLLTALLNNAQAIQSAVIPSPMARRIPSAAVGPGVAPHCPECNAKALRATSRFCDLCGAALVSDGEPRSSHYARAIATSDDLGVAPTEAGVGAEEGHHDVQMLRVSFDVQQLPDLARLAFEAYHGMVAEEVKTL